MSQNYEIIINDHLDSGSTSKSISRLDDDEVIKLYKKKIERKRGANSLPKDNKYKISRDYEVLFVKNNGVKDFGKGKRLFALLAKGFNKRIRDGLQKIREFQRYRLWAIQEETICVDDIKLPIDLKKAQEGLENIDDVWRRKLQLLIISGFMKVSYQQKQVIKKRQELESALGNMRIQQVFSILKDFTIRKRTKGIQTDLLNPTESILHKVDSTATMLESFFSKTKGRTLRNPFSKLKDDKNDATSINMDDSKISQPTSFHTINLKMNKLQKVLNEARKIRENSQLTKRYSSRLPDLSERRQKDVSIAEVAHHSCLQIKGNLNDSEGQLQKNKKILTENEEERGRTYSKQSGDFEIYKPILHKFPSKETNDQRTKRYGSVAPQTSKSREFKSKAKIHQIIQPVIHQVIQPIHYHHVSFQSHTNTYQNYYPTNISTSRSYEGFTPMTMRYSECRQYKPSTFEKDRIDRTPTFSRVYSATPKFKNKIWS